MTIDGVIIEGDIGPVLCAHCGELVDIANVKGSTVVMTSRDSAFIIHNPCLEEMHTRSFILDSEAKHAVIQTVLDEMMSLHDE